MVAETVAITGETPVQTKEDAMKNQLKVVLLTALFAIPAHSSADIRPSASHTIEPSRNIFDLPINDLDPIAQESIRGGLAPLAIALGVAGVDLALMGFFWGVYLPYYAPSGPSYYTEAP